MSEVRPAPAGGVWFGGDHNPDQWSEEVLREDIDLMRRARVNTVTIGVFSWSTLEPEPGVYDFGWLDAALARFHDAGIRVVLATPTASPPPWFSRLHPEALPVTADGVRLLHGSRDTYNPAAPAYRAAARRITRALAERYGAHPAVALWHVHNEYGTVSYGPVTDAAFRAWLQERYGDLDTLNAVWNAPFWSQVRRSWDDVHAPQATQYLHNPGHMLDFRRFSADMLRQCLRDQVEILRELSPSVPVTTNLMLPSWHHLDEWDVAREVDVVSVDHYLDDEGPAGEAHAAFGADLARSFAGGRPWLLMEQATTVVYDYAGGRMLPKAPGRMRRNTFQYLARGASGSLFFQWRSPLVGAEFFHSAMVPHAGADTRIFREVAALGADLAQLGDALSDPGARPVVAARVAIVWGSDAWWATQTPMLPSGDVAFLPAVRRVHTALWEAGIVTDVVAPDGDLSAYDLVLAPSLIPVSDTQRASFEAYVRAGGHLAVWHFAGSTDEHLRVRAGSGYSAAFAELAGIRVEEPVPLPDGAVLTLSDGSTAGSWSELVHLVGARAVALYTADAHPVIGAGSPAITRHAVDGGVVHYLSTRLDDAALRTHLARIVAEAGVTAHPDTGDGLEIVRRRTDDGHVVFAINHSDAPRTLRVTGRDLLTGDDVDGTVSVGPGDVRVVREGTGPAT